ncbi:MAG TPA: SapC family protein [Rhizomicrobium sp.]|jgi:hypothetical protein
MSESGQSRLPTFYAGAVPLSSTLHAAWRLLPGDAGFAAQASAVPLTGGEFAAASSAYPILFTADEPSPVALMGLARDNLFVEEGRWAKGSYVPAYVRRYPFILIEAQDKSGYALGIDQTGIQVAKSGKDGEPLFEAGEPGPVTRRALEFCRLFNEDHLRTRAFCGALVEADLLVDRRADVALPDGRKLGVAGFKVVDAERFAKLDDARVLDWHRKGWLALVNFHLASLARFDALLMLQGQRSATEASSSASNEASEKAARD